MADNLIYWLWLQDCVGAGARVKALLEGYKDARELYLAGENAWKAQKPSHKAYGNMRLKSPEDYAKTVEFCSENKIYILCPDDEYYPQRLLETENYPLALYVRGDYKILNKEKTVAVIGSRTPCVYGQRSAEKIVSRLVESDYLIVSGGALGMDSVAHKSAITAGGKTVLVMGCGHGNGYLPENSALRKLVANNGALITEYPPRHPVTQNSFPMRNRIISALSKGVAIIEAADPSGTFNTANHALEQSRDIFVLPGDIESGNFAGSNRLITEGAIPVFSGDDILLYYGEAEAVSKSGQHKTGDAFREINVDSEFSKKNSKHYKKKTKKACADIDENETEKKEKENNEKTVKNCPEGISKNAAIVYNIMSADITAVDDIARKSGLDVRKVLAALTELEMFGAAEIDGPGKYRLK
ncbi:MAG: DNA-protecting protein DprA [Ruminococcaceae bacterium]|nr:DNA-protecting protein DprA [Oscillospiraceae bacterium]